MLDQRRRRWADVVQMLYTCFVFAGMSPNAVLTFNHPLCVQLVFVWFIIKV